jgi:xylulokinase
MSNIYLGLDLGTSGCKLIAFDASGGEIARAARGYSATNPGPGLFELDADLVWQQAEACFREVRASALDGRVRSLAISVLGEAVIPVDHHGKALAPSIISADMRAEAEVRALGDRLGAERIYAITGQPLASIHSLPKLMWWRKHRPDIIAKSWKFLCFGEFALMRLGLPPTIDEGMAARMMAFDIERRAWSQELLDVAGFTISQLADVAPSGTVLGVVAPDAAARLALPAGVQVVLGGHDQPMGALGAGAVTPGDAVYSLGTTEALVVPLRGGSAELFAKNIPCYPHVVSDLRVGLAGNQSGGRVLAWYRKVTAASPAELASAGSLDELFASLVDGPPTWPILLPHFLGSGSVLNDHDSLGALYGLRFDTTRSDILLALLEGITFEQALSLEALAGVTDPIRTLRVIGGGTRSALWLQMKADILNRPLARISVQDASCLGAAILGRWALDGSHPIPEIARSMIATSQTFHPRPARHAAHAERFGIYRSIYDALKPLAPRLRAQWSKGQ